MNELFNTYISQDLKIVIFSVTKEKCLDNPAEMLYLCRETCTKLHENEKILPEILRVLGGLGNIFTDQFGFKLNICSEAEFSEEQESKTLSNNLIIDERLPYIPKFTENGFEKSRIPESLFKYFDEKMKTQETLENWVQETAVAVGYINNQVLIENVNDGGRQDVLRFARTKVLSLDIEDIKNTFITLGPLAEAWAGVKLKPSGIYGIRRYCHHSILLTHVDK